MKRKIKIIFLIIGLVQYSCNNDDDIIIDKNPIIGDWLRADFTETIEYQIHFENNNFGKIINVVSANNGIISSANPFSWSINKGILNITLDDGTQYFTSVEFNNNGNLILADFSELEFIKF